ADAASVVGVADDRIHAVAGGAQLWCGKQRHLAVAADDYDAIAVTHVFSSTSRCPTSHSPAAAVKIMSRRPATPSCNANGASNAGPVRMSLRVKCQKSKRTCTCARSTS